MHGPLNKKKTFFSAVFCIFAALPHRRYINALCGVRLATQLPDATRSVMSPAQFSVCSRDLLFIAAACGMHESAYGR